MRPEICACVLALATTLACGSAAAAEQVYRWVDEQGVVHYSQIAPEGRNWQQVTPGERVGGRRAATLSNPRRADTGSPSDGGTSGNVTTGPATSGGQGASNSGEEPRLSERQRSMQQDLQEEAQARLAEVEQTRRENCQRAREQFRQFTAYARIRVEDEDGGTRILSEEERQERIDQAQEAIVLNCEGGDEG